MKREIPKYRVVYDQLKSEILGGRYGAKSPFPSEVALSRRFKTGRSTVKRALDELHHEGLVCSQQGRGTFVTRQSASRRIGLVMPGFATSEFFQPLAATIIRLANSYDYELLFTDIHPFLFKKRVRQAQEFVDDLIRREVSGVIYQPLEYAADTGLTNRSILSALESAGIPVVLIDSEVVPPPERSHYDLISIDNVMAGKMLVWHLISSGARRIHFVMRPNWYPNVRSRLDGVICGLMEARIGWSERQLLCANPEDVSMVRRHLQIRPRPDAFICESDQTAAAFKLTLDRLGVRVPEDVLLAGFDDVKLARLMTPPLTSVRQPCELIAESAFHRIIQRIGDPSIPPMAVFHSVTLSIRESTNCSHRAKINKEAK